MEIQFPADYPSIVDRMDSVDPVKYGITRNYVNGDVTYLSPYISRGVISTRQVLEHVLNKEVKIPQIESFVMELCWRDYFQRVAQSRDVTKDIKQPQQNVLNTEVPTNIINANTGIEGIDKGIEQLCINGYMHNHLRMYTASVVCNIAKSHWLRPANWMYYHLLDGDWASNNCSWQWVAGSNSNKKYFANQENINRYCNTHQTKTFLDCSYEVLEKMEMPRQLRETQTLVLQTLLPESDELLVDVNLPTFIYNYYNLDPLWHAAEKGNRILLLEPDFFTRFPVSEKCVDFMLELAKNIQDIQVYVGSFESLATNYHLNNFYYKEHPLNKGYAGTEEPRDWIIDSVNGYFPSFFAYWKKVEKQLYTNYNKDDY